MGRPVLLLVGAAAFAGLLVAYGAFAWFETERRVLGAAEAEGRAVLESVRAGVESSVDASAAVDQLLCKRLEDLAARLDQELADEPSAPKEVAQRFAKEHALAGVVVLDQALTVRGAASRRGDPPRAGSDVMNVAGAEGELLAADVRRAAAKDGGWTKSASIRLGFANAPLSAAREFVVAVRAPKSRGAVILRQDASEFREFDEKAGVARLLREAAGGPGVSYLVLQPTGAAPPPTSDAGARVLDVSLPVRGEVLHVGLSMRAADEQIARGRRDVVVFCAVALAAGAAALVLLLRRARREVLLAEREKFASLGRLAAGVAHEVRSPLNALSMAAQRLQREAAPASEPERGKFLELTTALKTGVLRLDGTIREFLELGQVGAPPQIAPVDVVGLVDEILAAEGVAAAKTGAPLVVAADRRLLAKALANLVRNAQQIAPGTVRVAWARDGARATIEVTDAGPGVPDVDRARVFEPFFTKRPGGTGLGLAICRDAVERQGGRITVDAAAGGGARFAIDLPVAT
jgi:signal transduction histidine kinase